MRPRDSAKGRALLGATLLFLSGCTTLNQNPDFCGARCAVQLDKDRQAESVQIDWYANGGPGSPVFPFQREKLGRLQPRSN